MPVQVSASTKVEVPRALLDDALLTALQNAGQFRIIGQDDVNAVLGFERQKELLGCDETMCFAELGGALGADYLFSYRVGQVGSRWQLSGKLINIRQGKVDVVGRHMQPVDGELEVLFDALPGFVRALLVNAELLQADPPVAAPPPRELPELEVETMRLPNGLGVVLHRDARTPTVAFNAMYVDSLRAEPREWSGLAHLMEHLFFAGTKKNPPYPEAVKKLGAKFFNGTTSNDELSFFVEVPRDELEELLALESDRMANLSDALTPELLRRQLQVILSESEQARERNPTFVADGVTQELLYPRPHAYHRGAMGNVDALQKITVDDVRLFMRSFSSPTNVAIALSGDFDMAVARRLVSKYFAGIQRAARPALQPVPDAKLKASRRELKIGGQGALVRICWRSPRLLTEGDAAADVLSLVLGERLRRTLVDELGVAERAGATQHSGRWGSSFCVDVTGRAGVAAAQLEKSAWEVIRVVRKESPSPVAIAKARDHLVNMIFATLERPTHRVRWLSRNIVLTGKVNYVESESRRYDAVDVAAVRSAAQQILREGEAITILAAPR